MSSGSAAHTDISRLQAGAGGQALVPQAEPLLGYSGLRVHVVRPAGPSEQEAAEAAEASSRRDEGGGGNAAHLPTVATAVAGLGCMPAAADAAVELIDLSEPPDEVFLQLLRWSSEATVKRQKLLAGLPT